MVAELLGLPSVFLFTILFVFTTNGQTTPPAPFPEVKIKHKGEVVYKDTSVYGVLGKAVILECGSSKPDLYIWSFTKPGTEAIKAVVYDLGRGPRPQTLAKTLGQVTVISNSADVSIQKLPLVAHGLFTCQAFYDIDTEARVYYYYVHLTVRVPVSKPYLVLSDVSPVEGTTMWMRCKLDNGTGPIQYIWRQETRNGSVIDYEQTNTNFVNMTNINRNHTGWYRCVARNPVNSEKSDRIWLDIIFGPDLPQIDVTPHSITERGYSAQERETVSLLCQALSNPPSSYVWHYNNSQIASGSQYTITNVLRMHTGTYACLAQNTYLNTRSKKTISLTVYFGPDLPQIDVTPSSTTEHGYSVLERENVSLLCQAESFPPSQYIWFYNNSQVSTGPELTITNILRMQTGDYTCWAQNTYLNTQSNTNISLTVYYPPNDSPSCSMDIALNHTSLRLLCFWPGGLPPPTLNWNGEDVATGQQTNPLNNTAILLPPEGITYSNSLFTCSGSHPALKQPTECSLRTYVPPGELLCFANVTNNLQYLMLSCSWDGGVPKALVRWEGPGGQSKSEEESSNTLVLLYGTAHSERPYTCHAKHPLLGQTQTCRVSLVSISKPYVMVSNVNPLEGSNIWLRCNVENGTEPIQYVWQYETSSGEITVFPQSNTSMVNMPNINRNHTGWYDCQASNAVNRDRSDRIWLNIVYPPEGSPSCSMDIALNHTSLRLLCSWPGGVPPPTLNWNGEDVASRQQTNLLSNTAILVPPEGVTYSNSLFTCSGSHPALKQPTECSIRTYVPPGELLCFANVTNNLEYLMLSCFWDGGVPKALVRWEGPGGQGKSEEENSNILVLLYGTAHSERPYTCHAKHPLLGQTKTCRVSLVSVSKPYISVSDANPLEGSNIWMRCNVENGTRPIQYVWQYETQDGEITVFPQSNTSMVNMSSVNRDHTGWYRCVASNAVNRVRSNRIWLNIVYGPELPRIVMTPSNMTRGGYSALEKQRVSLLCEAQSNPVSQYIWFFNNSQVNTGPELTIASVQRMQTGDYACLAQNIFLNTRSKKTISLTVYYPPNGSPSCSVEAAVNHTSLKLLCFWAGGFPPPALTWSGHLKRTGPEQLSTKQQSNRNSTMVVPSEGISSNSSFTCIGSHPVLRQPTGCIIRTYVPPGDPVCFAYVTNNKQYLMLSCSWDGGVPKALVWWEGPGGQNKGGQENSNILIIRYGSAHSHKPYFCHAKHPLLGQTKTCKLTLEAPVLLTQRRVVSVFEGSDVQLTCNLRSNYLPTNEITWFNNHGKGIQDTSKYILLRTSAWTNLTVRDTDERQDSGEYRCTTSNAVGGTEINVTLVVKRHPMPPNATLVRVMYNSRHRNQVELEWQVHEEEENQGKWTGFYLEHRWVSERPGRKSNSSNPKVKNQEKNSQIEWYRNIIQDPESRSYTIGSLIPTVTYQFRIIPFNRRTLGHPSAPKTPAEPRYNALPAIIGAALGGMLFAVILTMLLLIFIIRNRNNNPRLHDLLFGMQHGQSRENINFPEDEVVGGSEGGIEDIGGLSSSGPSMALPRAASPLTVTPQSATSTGQAPPPGDDNEPVSVTITVKATGS